MFFEVGKMEIIHLPGYSNWQSAKHVMCTTAWASDWPMSYFGEPPRYPSIEQFSPWFGTRLQRQLESPQHDTILPLSLHGFTCIYVVLCHAFGPVTFHLCTPSRIFLTPMVPLPDSWWFWIWHPNVAVRLSFLDVSVILTLSTLP